MNKTLIDTSLALASGTSMGVAYLDNNTNANPIITGIIIPIVSAVIIPFLKDLLVIWMTDLKEKRKKKKSV